MRRVVIVCVAIALVGAGIFTSDARAQESAPLRAQARNLFEIGMLSYRAGNREGLERAIEIWVRAADIYGRAGADRHQAHVLSNIGSVYQKLGHPDSALAYLSEALPLAQEESDRRIEAFALNEIAKAQHDLGRTDSARLSYRNALGLWRELGDRRAEAAALGNLGALYLDVGRPDSAIVYIRAGLSFMRDVGDRRGEAKVLGNLGRVQSILGRPDSALAHYETSLRIRRATGDRRGQAVMLNNVGYVHQTLGRLDSALAYYEQALPITREVGDRRFEGITLNNVGYVHQTLGRLDSALTYYERALAIRREVGDQSGQAATLNNIGSAHHILGHSDSALAYFERVLPLVRATGDRHDEAMLLANIGMAFISDAPPRPAMAVAYYDSAASVLASVARRAGGDANRLSFVEQDVGMFAHWALAWLALEEEVGEREAALAALAATERGRAQALLDLMRKSAGEARLPVPAPGSDLAAEGRRLVEAGTAGGTSVLSYLVTSDTLLAWLATPAGELEVYRRPVAQGELSQTVAALRAGLGADVEALRTRFALSAEARLEESRGVKAARVNVGEIEAPARQLSEWLLPAALGEALAASGGLVVVPHGPLHLVPFAALPTGRDGEPLGLRFPLRYAPSLAMLREGSALSADDVGDVEAALVVGNPTMPQVRDASGERVQLAPLPGAENEANWVAGELGVTPLSGSDATEAAVKERLPTASHVHLATHGYAYSSEVRARDSFVALGPDPAEDGLLTVGEVLDEVPPLTAKMVVLSACQTGLGDLNAAEGTVGLQRAFLARGAERVLVSLWSVSDAATEALMRSFYRHGRLGKSPAEALRQAQAEVRQMPGFGHPRYWAAFQLVGRR